MHALKLQRVPDPMGSRNGMVGMVSCFASDLTNNHPCFRYAAVNLGLINIAGSLGGGPRGGNAGTVSPYVVMLTVAYNLYRSLVVLQQSEIWLC